MCDFILKQVKELFPEKDVSEYGFRDDRFHGFWKKPSIFGAFFLGYLRVAKVLKKHGFPDDVELSTPAEGGYLAATAYLMQRHWTDAQLERAMMRCAEGLNRNLNPRTMGAYSRNTNVD